MDEGGEEKREVRRPMNAFLIFCKRHRGFIREKNPDMDNRSVTRVLGDLWSNLGEEKKIYTNLAKQYKDAFMRANPSYKWHKTERIHGSSNRVVIKSANFGVNKRLAEIPTDGVITPGKLADLDKMGGLNLLLMAERKACEGQSPRTESALSGLAEPAKSALAETRSQSALLQLAEICTSELESTTEGKLMSEPCNLLLELTQTNPPPSLSPTNSVSDCPEPMPPPKKRAYHWSWTETDSPCDTSDGNGKGEITGTNAQTWSKLRSASLGSSLCSEHKYSSIDANKSASLERRLSSSATESIPSPTTPCPDGIEDSDLPVFSPEMINLETHFISSENILESKKLYDPRSFVQCLYSPDKVSAHHSGTAAPKPLPPPEPRSEVQKPHVNHFHLEHPLNLSLSGMSRHSSLEEDQMTLLKEHQSSLSHKKLLDPPYAASSSWRESGNPEINICETYPENVKSALSSDFISEVSSPILRLNLSLGKIMNDKDVASGPLRYTLACDSKTLAAPSDLKSSSHLYPSYEKTAFSSLLSEGRMASLLTCNDSPKLKLALGVTEILRSTVNSRTRNMNRCSSNDREMKISRKLPLADLNTDGQILRQAHGVAEADSSTQSLASGGHTQTFSEGKLKKKWTQRMLSEAKLEEEQNISQTSAKSEANETTAVSVNDQQNGCRDSDTRIISPQRNDKLLYPTFRNLFELEDLKTMPLQQAESLTACENCNSVSSSAKQAGVFDSYTAGSCHSHRSASFNASSHPKLMMQLSQNQQSHKPHQSKLQICLNDNNIKGQDAPDLARKMVLNNSLSHDFTYHKNGTFSSKDGAFISGADIKIDMSKDLSGEQALKDFSSKQTSQDLSSKQILNQMAACGKKFMEHIVEQLCKTDFSEDQHFVQSTHPVIDQHVKTEVSANTASDSIPCAESSPVSKKVPQCEFGAVLDGLKQEKLDGSMKEEENIDYSVLTASSLVEKVIKQMCGSQSSVEEYTCCRKTQEANAGEVLTKLREKIPASQSASLDQAASGVPSDKTRTHDTCNHKLFDQPDDAVAKIDTDSQGQGSFVSNKSCDTEISGDGTAVPVRKSRRANRGQKYQELIKEGFIQPSRERLAARNAERHGKMFGNGQEKIEVKRILKRSASEKDAACEDARVVSVSDVSAAKATALDKKCTSREFDLEKEIKLLPVCSLGQMDKKRTIRHRHCEDEAALMVQCRKISTATTPQPSPDASFARSSLLNSCSSCEVEVGESKCPTSYIDLPKNDGPATEPVTGSRKRKARKHCITRISVLDEARESVRKCISSQLPVEQSKRIHCTPSVGIGGGNITSSQTATLSASADGKHVRGAIKCEPDGAGEKRSCAIDVKENVAAGRNDTLRPRPYNSHCSTVFSSSPSHVFNSSHTPHSTSYIKRSPAHSSVTADMIACDMPSPSLTSTLYSTDSSPQHTSYQAKMTAAGSSEMLSSCTGSRGETSPKDNCCFIPPAKAEHSPDNDDSRLHPSLRGRKPEKASKKLVKCDNQSKKIKASLKEPPKRKHLDKEQKKVAKRNLKLKSSSIGEVPPASVKKSRRGSERKTVQEMKSSVVSTDSSKPSAPSKLDGPSAACSFVLVGRSPGIASTDCDMMSASSLEASISQQIVLTDCSTDTKTAKKSMLASTLSVDSALDLKLKTVTTQPGFQESQDMPLCFEALGMEHTESALLPVNSVTRRIISTPAKRCPSSSGDGVSNENLISVPRTEVDVLFPIKPLLKSVSDTTSDPGHDKVLLTNSSLFQPPCHLTQNSSSATGSTLASSSSSHLSAPPLSSAVTNPASVISLATSASSVKTDIVTYTVIGSPHLPESPSVTFVQS